MAGELWDPGDAPPRVLLDELGLWVQRGQEGPWPSGDWLPVWGLSHFMWKKDRADIRKSGEPLGSLQRVRLALATSHQQERRAAFCPKSFTLACRPPHERSG